MPEINANQADFTVSATGEVSGRTLSGKFTVKRRLSFKDQLAKDNRRRELLGPAKGEPSASMTALAEVMSELYVRVVDAPSWWKDSDDGLNLEDDAIVGAVYNKTMEIAVESNVTLKAAADKAKADLAKVASEDKQAA